ncbi:MAG: bifunctional hydroxymethylpyrimidine kinase/phosphomethylpyrimidine kinase [Gammaproteobacteria bacterium]
MNTTSNTPVVLALSGADPTGGAGIQADIETIASLGCHTAPIITSVTAQDTTNVVDTAQINEHFIIQQARVVLEDMKVAAIKIGLIVSDTTAMAIHTLLTDYKDIPVVLDPIIIAGGGKVLANEDVVDAINTLLVPLATVVTPNSDETRSLAPEGDTLDACAMAILERGAHYVLVTGTHEKTDNVCNVLFGNNRKLDTHNWPRLPDQYHGSGCTLSSAIAANIARGQDVVSATHHAQEYTWKCLQAARQLGMGQKIPNRFHWLK